MDLMVEIYLERAENELLIAEKLKILSEDKNAKEFMGVGEGVTFYSSVISHSYYSIFYAAKAILLAKNIKTYSPEIHKKTYDAFEETFVKTGLLDVKLLKIYKELIIKADYLLEIFKDEKKKRGDFVYKTIHQANKEPAHQSIDRSKIFVANIIKVTKTL